MKKIKRTISIILAFSLVFSIFMSIPFFTSAASLDEAANRAEINEENVSEKCGDNIKWNYEGGILTVTGSGRMYDYEFTNNYFSGITTDLPWKDYLSSINKVVLNGNISYIGNNAFSDCTSLKSVQFPSSLSEIGENAFSRCISLVSVSIPDGTTLIGKEAFIGCEKLQSVALPSGLTEISPGMFSACYSLSNLKIPDNVKSIGSSAFNCCYKLKNIELPYGLERIGMGAFFKCELLTQITIPDTVTEILGQAFQLCTSLSEITLSDSITRIETNTFANCVNLSKVNLSSNLKYIGYGAFYQCESLKQMELPYSVEEVSEKAFMDCISLSDVTINNPFVYLYNSDSSSAFGNNTADICFYCYDDSTTTAYCKEKELPYKLLHGKALKISADDNVSVYDGNVHNEEVNFKISENAENLQIRYYLSDKLGCDGGFSSMSSLVNFVRSYGDKSFFVNAGTYPIYYFVSANGYEVASGKVNIVIEKAYPDISFAKDNVTKSFWSNQYKNQLTVVSSIKDEIKYTSSDTTVATVDSDGTVKFTGAGSCVITACFEGNLNYYPFSTSYSLSVNLLGKGTYDDFEIEFFDNGSAEIIKYNGSDSDLIIPSEVYGYKIADIKEDAFWRNTNIKSIKISDGIESIGEYSFSGCKSLTDISIPNSIVYIGDFAFLGCSRLENIIIPDSVTDIGYATFVYCENLKSVIISDNVKTIGSEAFFSCTSLENITIPKSVTSIGKRALGYYYDEHNNYTKMSNFKIYGYKGTAAENYAKENGFDFVPLDEDSVLGDVNSDGEINAKDRMTLTRYLAKWSGYENIDMTAADVSNDGLVNAKDRMILTRHLAKWQGYETLPYTS